MPIISTLAGASARGLGGLRTFAVPALGSYEWIANVGPGNNTSTSLTFSNIPTTYTHLQIRGNGQGQYGGSTYGAVGLRVNGDTNNNYDRRAYVGNTPSSFTIQSNSWMQVGVSQLIGSAEDNVSIMIIDLFNYRNTTFKRLAKGWGGIATPTGTEVSLGSGHWTGSVAITDVTLFQPNGNWEADASFSLYGIKG